MSGGQGDNEGEASGVNVWRSCAGNFSNPVLGFQGNMRSMFGGIAGTVATLLLVPSQLAGAWCSQQAALFDDKAIS